MKTLKLVLRCGNSFMDMHVVDSSQTLIDSVSVTFVSDPMELVYAMRSCLSKLSKSEHFQFDQLSSMTIVSSGNGCLIWDRETGEPFSKLLGSHERVSKLVYGQFRKRGLFPYIREKTGLNSHSKAFCYKAYVLLDALLDNEVNSDSELLVFGGIESWLLYNLTNKKSLFTDITHAQSTLLFDVVNMEWDCFLLKEFGLQEHWLPDVISSGDHFGETEGFTPLPNGLPIESVTFEQQALFSAFRLFRYKEALLSFDSNSCELYINEGTEYRREGADFQEWILPVNSQETRFILQKSVWLPSLIGDWEEDRLSDCFSELTSTNYSQQELLSESSVQLTPGKGSLFSVEPEVTTTIRGLHKTSTTLDLFKGYLKAIVFSVFRSLEDIQVLKGLTIPELNVYGKGFEPDILCELQASALQLPVLKCEIDDPVVCGSLLSDVSIPRRIFKQYLPELDPITVFSSYRNWVKDIQNEEGPKQLSFDIL